MPQELFKFGILFLFHQSQPFGEEDVHHSFYLIVVFKLAQEEKDEYLQLVQGFFICQHLSHGEVD